MRGGSSGTMIMIVVVMLVCMSSIMMCTMGPLGGLLGGLGSLTQGAGDLVGGAGDLVGGAASGIGQGLSAAGDVVSGEAFKPNLTYMGPSNLREGWELKACRLCSVRNWEGSAKAAGKEYDCSSSRIRSLCDTLVY